MLHTIGLISVIFVGLMVVSAIFEALRDFLRACLRAFCMVVTRMVGAVAFCVIFLTVIRMMH